MKEFLINSSPYVIIALVFSIILVWLLNKIYWKLKNKRLDEKLKQELENPNKDFIFYNDGKRVDLTGTVIQGKEKTSKTCKNLVSNFKEKNKPANKEKKNVFKSLIGKLPRKRKKTSKKKE